MQAQEILDETHKLEEQGMERSWADAGMRVKEICRKYGVLAVRLLPICLLALLATPPALAQSAGEGREFLFPLIADGGGYRSRLFLYLTNLHEGANRCEFELRGPGLGGGLFESRETVTWNGASAVIELPDGRSHLALGSVPGRPLPFGYAKLACRERAAAHMLLSWREGDSAVSMTALENAASDLVLQLPVLPRLGRQGLLVVNDNTAEAICSIELTGDSGAGAFAALSPAVNAGPTPGPGAAQPPPAPDSAPYLGDALPFEKTYPLNRSMPALELPKAIGGNAPLAYTLAPAVPGLRFNAAGNRLSGTPAREGNYAMTYRVTDADGDKDFFFFDIRVAAPDTAPRFAAADAPGDLAFEAGSPIAPLQLPAVRGGNEPIVYTLSPRAPGLRFDAATRTLAGTPWRIGTYEMTYRAEDHESETAALGFTVTVAARISPGELLDAGGCADGAFIDDPSSTPRLVGDCEALAAFANSLIRQGFLRENNVLRQWGRGARRKLEDWEGVGVSEGRVVRLESLFLQENRLTGEIPLELTGLDNLARLDLALNRLTGPLPEEFAAMPAPTFIELTGNRLRGTLPWNFRDRIDEDGIHLGVDGNLIGGYGPRARR